jgi:hypothetical protein
MSHPQPQPDQPSWAQQPQPGQPYPPQPGPGAPGQQWVPPQPQPPKKKPNKALIGCGGCAGVVALFVIIAAAVAAGSKSGTTNASSAPRSSTASSSSGSAKAPAAAAPRPDTVTYIVTGSSDADVQYGPSGSSSQGHVPLDKTEPLGNPQFYSITAQLQGSGDVVCKLEVNGKVISQSTATGGYNIASCEISKDPFGDGWKDTNSG